MSKPPDPSEHRDVSSSEANRRLRLRVRELETELARLAESGEQATAALRNARAERRRLKRELAEFEDRRLVRLALRADHVIKAVIGRKPVPGPEAEDSDRPPKPAKMKTKTLKVQRRAARSLGAAALPAQVDRPVEAPQVKPWIDLLRVREPVSIVVPIHGALEALETCIDSVVRNTTSEADLVLIDDGSADGRLDAYLAALEERLSRIRVLRRGVNRGFPATANEGFDVTSHDVVLLNSDTEVPPRWLESLRRVADSDPSIGTVTALSNNAGAFSAPAPGANDLPASIDAVGRAVAQESGHIVPETPTAHGFCMYVKRCVLDAIGGFDVDSFPRGYGEENDFCMRASDAGWRHVVDDSTFVRHVGSASFQEERDELRAAARSVLNDLHPDYSQKARDFRHSPDLASAREAAGRAVARCAAGDLPRPRVLYVLHDGGGGTAHTAQDLVQAISGAFEPLVLRSTAQSLHLTNGLSGHELASYPLDPPLQPSDFSRSDYRDIVARILVERHVEIVHIRHLLKHTFDLPSVGALLEIPVVLSLHDFYYCCPTTHLLDDVRRYCAGRCTEGQGVCPAPKWFDTAPHLKHGWVNEWQRQASAVLEEVSLLVTTSESTATVYRDLYPALRSSDIRIIEHGRDLVRHASIAKYPEAGEPVRLLLLGDTTAHKGAHLLAEIQELDTERRLEFHVLGSLSADSGLWAVHHGRYDRSEIAERAAGIQPAAIVLLSIWPETYSHVLTEAWSLGAPVIVSNLGALPERVNQRGGGWIVDVGDPRVTYQQILDCFADGDEWECVRRSATAAGLPTTSDMGESYASLYDRLGRARRCFASPSDLP
jgi:GT2 family glycosyltransferase/glycosyltransferase involved in cell wall biosynthesis